VTVVREPLYRTVPDCRESFGDLAAKVGVALGLPPDPEQQAILDATFAESSPGIPRYRHVCVIGARQQIKSSTLTIAAATDLYVLGVPGAVWTAHLSSTATKSYEDLSRRVRAYPDFADLSVFRSGRGEERITLRNDEQVSLEYRARHGGAGRGFTTSRLTLDEALYLRPGDLGALLPTQLTRRDAQVRYGSSAGLTTSDVLRDLRDDGRADSDPGLFYVEYGAPRRDCQHEACAHEVGTDGCALDDRELWWQACSGLWCGRVDEAGVEDLRRRLPPEEFMREVLVWWDDPITSAAGVFGDLWLTLADPAAERGSPVAFGVAVAPDREWAAIAVAWQRPDGLAQVMLTDYHRSTEWVSERAQDLQRRWGGPATASTAARGLVAGAREPGEGEQTQAHTALDDRVRSRRVRHGNDEALNVAVRATRWKAYGNTRAFDRKGTTDISPLDAAALAVQGLDTAKPQYAVGSF